MPLFLKNFKKCAAIGKSLKNTEVLCTEMGVQHNIRLYHTNIRGFSRGHVLTRVFEFRDEIMLLFCEKSSDLCKIFESREFVILLAFLADIFSHLNDLNIKMQGTGVIIINTGEEINAFVQKLALWKRKAIKTILKFPFHELST